MNQIKAILEQMIRLENKENISKIKSFKYKNQKKSKGIKF